MTRTMFRILLHPRLASCVALIILGGCQPAQPKNDGVAQPLHPNASDSQSLATPPALGTVPAQASSSPSKSEAGPRRPSGAETVGTPRTKGTIPSTARRSDPSTTESLTVASFLDRSVDAGQRVQVTGTCLDQFHANGSAGPPPVSRSDWQLASGTRVVYVVGRMPAACAAGPLTITATVGIDTTLVGGLREPRRFLVISR
jgi:hypothetical protein